MNNLLVMESFPWGSRQRVIRARRRRDKRCTNDDSKEEERKDGLYSAGVRVVRVTEKESKPCFV
jgi:hypothetical protein|tara:strand:- start:1037 stop:1228 length:192 start_codon:yes stop_codon:yes gene_type:complete